MALLTVLFLVVFYGACIYGIAWLLKRYASIKPWHKWLRRGVWTGVFVLFFIDTIYYQIFVVHGMCAADKTRVYPAPPVSTVVAGPFTEEELVGKPKDYVLWPCKEMKAHKIGKCQIKNIEVKDNVIESLLFGSERAGTKAYTADGVLVWEVIRYDPKVHWLTKKLLNMDVGGFRPQRQNCEESFFTKKQAIILGE